MRKFISILVLAIALVGSVSAQSLDDLKKRAYDASVAASNASVSRKSAYEEYKESQKVVEERDFEENCNTLAAVAIRYPSEKNVWIKAYCYPVGDFVWYTIFYGDDNNWWINLAYDENDDVGELFYATKNKGFEYIEAEDDISGKKTAAIKLNNTNDYIVIIQDIYDPKTFAISW